MRLQQHDIPVGAQQPLQLEGRIDQRAGIIVGRIERSAPPGGRVEHDVARADVDSGRLEPGAPGESLVVVEQLAVDPGIPLLDDEAAERAAQQICLFVHLFGHERILREQEVGGEEVAEGVRRFRRARRHVVSHALERGPMPGVEVDLSRALAEFRREGRVVHEVLTRCERPVVGEGTVSHETHPSVPGELRDHGSVGSRIVEHPGVAQVGEVGGAEQLTEDRLGIAQRTVAREGLVENRAGPNPTAAPDRLKLRDDGAGDLPQPARGAGEDAHHCLLSTACGLPPGGRHA
jgi:hypothetical protein